MSSVEERVKKIVVEQLGVKEDEVTAEASFVDDLGADSLDTVELVMALEEEFKTEIPDEEAEKITTVQQAVDSHIVLPSLFCRCGPGRGLPVLSPGASNMKRSVLALSSVSILASFAFGQVAPVFP